ncbi:GGDEF domain-containing protein [Alicyclobacillus cellulosilyticus]|nr:sensor domain-containing diguanylate cyclase [Alicyclobacillus cellulosilyticus]
MPAAVRAATAVWFWLAADAACLGIAFAYLPWRPLPLWVWVAVAVQLAVVEHAWIPAVRDRRRLLLAAHGPWLMTCGAFPVIAVESAIWLAGQVYMGLRLRTFDTDGRWYGTALLAPLAAGGLQTISRAYGMPLWVSGVAVIAVYLLTDWAMQNLPGPRAVVHPWRMPRGWPQIWACIDVVCAVCAWVSMRTGAWTGTFLAILLTAGSAIAASASGRWLQQKMRLQAAVRCVAALHPEMTLEQLIHTFLREVRQVLVCDAAVFWSLGDDLHLRPQAVEAGTGGLALARYFTQVLRSMPVGTGLAGFCASSREPVVVSSPRQRWALFHMVDDAPFWSSGLAAPVCLGGTVFGVVALYQVCGYRVYREPERAWLRMFCQQFATILGHYHQYQESRLQSQTDELTGVYNYRYFDKALHHFVESCRETGEPVTLLIIDIDHFKQVNDRYGHQAGNQVLRQLADVLRRNVRGSDVLARYGGEEFTILMPGVSLAEGQAIADQIRMQVEETAFYVEDALAPRADGGPPPLVAIHITLSIGVASFPDGADSALTLLRYADRAVYLGAKQTGRNRVSVYSPAQFD